MTAVVVAAPPREGSAAGALFVAGIVLATLTEAIASTVLSLGRGYIIGDVHVTPDEFAWLDVGYMALKLIGFMTAPLLVHRVDPRRLIIGSTLVMGIACGLTIVTVRLELLIALRMIQGLAGGVLLVAGQATIFDAYPQSRQPILQALFAMGSVVAPATIAPALQGWLIDSRSWVWIFFSVVPLALGAAGLLLIADGPKSIMHQRRPIDWIGIVLIVIALFCFTYVLNQGRRWDWFEESRILWLTVIGAAALLAFLGRQVLASGGGLLDFSLFESEDFCFAFVVSFVAGAALFGSAFLIPFFAVSVLGFRPTDAGLLLLPSGACFVVTLLVAAFLMQVRRVPPVATVPFGILMIAVAMWMLSGSTSESGAHDMMAAILLRGLGLGFLFLSITLIAFGNLGERNRAFGIGLFNTSRQLGGLIGVAGLETLIEHHTAGNLTVLGANLTAGVPAVGERLTSTAAMLSARGMDALAGRVATSLLDGVLIRQSTVIAFDAAFNAVALLFVFAVPVLVTVKIGLHRYAQMRATQSRRIDAPRIAGVAVPVACASACNGSNCSTATAIALAQRQSRSGRPSPCPNSAWRAMGTNAAGTTKLEISSSRTDLPEDRALASADPAHATSL
ncbi:DHA2 family efflux MFS transporter permease subunit [Bradyrhizobium sp. 1(2017)]|uniref:DHA2 family efflux MFS transporter permease subunit n=1 Tax=Bradyrhizobium sp. 1(2017) TaxID=1404888 RepID=UPI00140EAFB0|nr:DHA2 family efflux MFS transporter permease subunit [Bradyrhizobium sp. 1(2017)]QIO30405.1 DHA2 family efflux MFS transporter permease subunit [Bradyrhizobium sp. 1(2017)]